MWLLQQAALKKQGSFEIRECSCSVSPQVPRLVPGEERAWATPLCPDTTTELGHSYRQEEGLSLDSITDCCQSCSGTLMPQQLESFELSWSKTNCLERGVETEAGMKAFNFQLCRCTSHLALHLNYWDLLNYSELLGTSANKFFLASCCTLSVFRPIFMENFTKVSTLFKKDQEIFPADFSNILIEKELKWAYSSKGGIHFHWKQISFFMLKYPFHQNCEQN